MHQQDSPTANHSRPLIHQRRMFLSEWQVASPLAYCLETSRIQTAVLRIKCQPLSDETGWLSSPICSARVPCNELMYSDCHDSVNPDTLPQLRTWQRCRCVEQVQWSPDQRRPASGRVRKAPGRHLSEPNCRRSKSYQKLFCSRPVSITRHLYTQISICGPFTDV